MRLHKSVYLRTLEGIAGQKGFQNRQERVAAAVAMQWQRRRGNQEGCQEMQSHPMERSNNYVLQPMGPSKRRLVFPNLHRSHHPESQVLHLLRLRLSLQPLLLPQLLPRPEPFRPRSLPRLSLLLQLLRLRCLLLQLHLLRYVPGVDWR